jgi:hypothetical protein
LGFEDFALEPLALPHRIVGILNLNRIESRRFACAKRRVERADLLDRHADRPTVADQVMQVHHENVFVLREFDQPGAHQRAVIEVEGHVRIQTDNCLNELFSPLRIDR